MTFDPGSRRGFAASVLLRAPAGDVGSDRRSDAASAIDRLIGTLPQAPVPRVLDRVIHARNAGAYGYFEAFGHVGDVPAAALTRAGLFQQAGTRTPVFVRFSTVAHGGHGPETVRDPRGFSIRFFTDEGRWDLVGSSLPVSFVRDPTLFPSVAHAFRPEPLTHRLEPRRIFDFIRFTPSALHMLTWLFSPWGIPANYRAMCGFSAGRWINADGATSLVRYRLQPAGGVRNLTQAEADAVQARNFNHATQDLYEAIARDARPEWSVAVQLIDERAIGGLDFDAHDPTALWPVERFPLHTIGRLVLDRNPKNYFAEVEQAVFSADAVVDGLTSTASAARALPAIPCGGTAPHAAERDRAAIGATAPLDAAASCIAARGARRGERIDHHRRAGDRYRCFTDPERAELVRNLVNALRECDDSVQAHMIEHFTACDPDYGRRIAHGLGRSH